MTDTEFAIRLAAGWAGHHPAGCALAVLYFVALILISRAGWRALTTASRKVDAILAGGDDQGDSGRGTS